MLYRQVGNSDGGEGIPLLLIHHYGLAQRKLQCNFHGVSLLSLAARDGFCDTLTAKLATLAHAGPYHTADIQLGKIVHTRGRIHQECSSPRNNNYAPGGRKYGLYS